MTKKEEIIKYVIGNEFIVKPNLQQKFLRLLDEVIQEQCNITNVSKRFSSAEKTAEWLHNNYEEIALNNGWKTQEDCQVPFCNLPKENKETMIELCERFLNVCQLKDMNT